MESRQRPGLADVAGLGSLEDPVRQRLYAHIAAAGAPVSREQAATAAGISRTLAAYHLDKLVEVGLLVTSYARPPGRGGPGAGRPAKQYEPARRELHVSVPPRNYPLLAGLLVEAVEHDQTGAVRPAVDAAARRAGRQAVVDTDVAGALRAGGYEPAASGEGGFELRNCPFHQLAQQHAQLVCGLNRQLVAGMLEATGEAPDRAELRPGPGRCCVLVHGTARPRRRRVWRRRGGTRENRGHD